MSSLPEIQRMLVEHEFFKDLPERFVVQLTPHVTIETYPAGEYIFQEGQDAAHCYLIRQGQVALEIYARNRGGMITLQTLDCHHVLGCSWLIPPYQWCFDARATQLTRILAIKAAGFREVLDSNREIGFEVMRRFLQVLAERLQAAQSHLSND